MGNESKCYDIHLRLTGSTHHALSEVRKCSGLNVENFIIKIIDAYITVYGSTAGDSVKKYFGLKAIDVEQQLTTDIIEMTNKICNVDRRYLSTFIEIRKFPNKSIQKKNIGQLLISELKLYEKMPTEMVKLNMNVFLDLMKQENFGYLLPTLNRKISLWSNDKRIKDIWSDIYGRRIGQKIMDNKNKCERDSKSKLISSERCNNPLNEETKSECESNPINKKNIE